MSHIFVLTNHKGGVRKSTSSTNLAHGILMVMQYGGVEQARILLIDTDSQRHTSLVTFDEFEIELQDYLLVPQNEHMAW